MTLSPAILASLWYASRYFSKYGSKAGVEHRDGSDGLNEETPLLSESPGEV